jgi:anti-anti-sigma factor
VSGRAFVELDGEIDLSVAEHVGRLLEEGEARAVEQDSDLYVDLAGVTFIDSTGLNAIVRTAVSLTAHQRRLRLRAVPPTVLRLLELSGLCGLVEVDGLG